MESYGTGLDIINYDSGYVLETPARLGSHSLHMDPIGHGSDEPVLQILPIQVIGGEWKGKERRTNRTPD